MQGVNVPAGPGPAPGGVPEGVQLGDDQGEAGDGEEPQEPEEPLEPYEIILQGFWTISQTLSAAYRAASAEIQIIVRKSLAKTTAEDRTFVWGASGAIRHWLDSVRPAMAATEKSTKDQAKLLAEAWQAGKDALNSILEFIPEEQEPKLTPVFPQATHLLALALAVARCYTDEALWNIHTQLVDLAKEHVPQEQVGALFNTILQVTCSFRQEMDNMATNQIFLPSQVVPNLWGSCRGLLEGLSLLGPPQLFGQLASILGGAGHSCTCLPECTWFVQDSDKVQPSPFRSDENNCRLWEEIAPISQTSCRVILGGQGKRKRRCRGTEAGREAPEEIHRARTFFR